MELTKKCIITHKNGVIQEMNTNFNGVCTPGRGFDFAEFETVEELEKYISENSLITQEEAKATKKAYINGQEVELSNCMFDDNVVISDIDNNDNQPISDIYTN